MRYPMDKFRITTQYGKKGTSWQCGYHSGTDFVGIDTTRVYPIESGKVYRVTTSGSYGNCVYIRHSSGYVSLYAHLEKVYVSIGQEVTESTCIGLEGETGNAKGKHLHLEVHKGEYHYPSTIDPLAFIEKGIEEETMTENIKIMYNGQERELTAIEKDGNYYVKLRDLASDKFNVSYDSAKKMPVVQIK